MFSVIRKTTKEHVRNTKNTICSFSFLFFGCSLPHLDGGMLPIVLTLEQ